MNNNNELEEYWTKRYQEERTGWDIGNPSTPLKTYIDQLENKDIRILIPGAGNAYEAEYLISKGFKNVFVMDISSIPLQQFAKRNPEFPKDQLLEIDFFHHFGNYDLILEQTFFCSFPPIEGRREAYANQMNALLKTNGKLVGVWFDIPLDAENFVNRPFGGTLQKYLSFFVPYFEVKSFSKCYNSIKPRQNQELFGVFQKK